MSIQNPITCLNGKKSYPLLADQTFPRLGIAVLSHYFNIDLGCFQVFEPLSHMNKETAANLIIAPL